MKVVRAEVLGMCFGVRDALKVMDEIAEPEMVTIHGELVHNPVVIENLDRRGFPRAGEADRGGVPATPQVLVTAHGISDTERRRLEAAGKTLVDTTCPLVTRVHRAAQTLQVEGYHVLVIGRRGHVEVRGIIEDLDRFDVVQEVAEVVRYPHPRLGVVAQTTTPERKAQEVLDAIVSRNPEAEVRYLDTVCLPTKEHQRALLRLIDQVDAMVVVGGRNSNNTRELVALCTERGLRAFHVEGPADLDPSWFFECSTVGLTAGTSTLDTTISAVHRALLQLSPVGVPVP